MKKLTVLGLHLGYGGIENAIATFVNNMCDSYDITLVSIYKLYNKPIYPIDDRVKIVYLIDDNLAIRVDRYKKLLRGHKILKLFKELWNDYIRRGYVVKLFKDTFNSFKIVKEKKTRMVEYLKDMNTDIVLSTRIELNELVSSYVGNDIKKVAWEHNHGDIEYIDSVIDSCFNMDNIVLVSNELFNLYKDEIGIKGVKLECNYITNIIDSVPLKVSSLSTDNIVSVGRLSSEKGFSDLIDVFKLISLGNKKATLSIIGDGSLYKDLDNKIKEEHLEKKVKLLGFKDKDYINNVYHNSSLYLMTSYTESFGLVLVEAMASGLPTIAFDTAEGAKALIDNGINGYLIKDRDNKKMADISLSLLKDRTKLKKMGKKAREVSLKYTKEAVHDKWKEIL